MQPLKNLVIYDWIHFNSSKALEALLLKDEIPSDASLGFIGSFCTS
jgi:hypothetical protein